MGLNDKRKLMKRRVKDKGNWKNRVVLVLCVFCCQFPLSARSVTLNEIGSENARQLQVGSAYGIALDRLYTAPTIPEYVSPSNETYNASALQVGKHSVHSNINGAGGSSAGHLYAGSKTESTVAAPATVSVSASYKKKWKNWREKQTEASATLKDNLSLPAADQEEAQRRGAGQIVLLSDEPGGGGTGEDPDPDNPEYAPIGDAVLWCLLLLSGYILIVRYRRVKRKVM